MSIMEAQRVSEEPVELVQLAEKILSQPIKDGLVSYCPSMDLLAVVTVDEQVQIFRLNGQRVVAIPAKRDAFPTKLCWKPSGSLLAIAYSDNLLSLIAVQGGKVVHQIHCPIPPHIKISALGWGVSLTDAHSVQALLARGSETSSHPVTLDDIIHRGFVGEIDQPKLSLPAEIPAVDVEQILPKLSVLPPGGTESEVFTTRASIDTLFHSKNEKSSGADVLIVGFDDGSAWLSVHDFFEVGRFDAKQVAPGKGFSIIKHAYHPYSSTEGLLLKREAQDQDELCFVPLDLKLIGDNSRQFSLLASKSTQLLNVLRYVKETQVQIYSEFLSSQTLPQRFVANVEEDLQEKEQTSFRIAAYHLVATGDCSPVMKEWLTDQLGDRGQKRWEKAANTGYENTRRLLHENFLPALDRICVLLTRLKGLALFHEAADAFGLSVLGIGHALDTLRCLHLLGHSGLLASDNELRLSSAFCAWLKQEIDTQATEHPPATLEEADKEPNFEYSDIFEYIEGPLQRSLLYELLDLKHDSDPRETVDMPSDEENIHDAYKEALRKVRDGQQLSKRLPGMAALVERLQKQCSDIFGNIADTQQRKVRFGEPISVGPCHPERLDLRLIAGEDDGQLTAYIAAVSPDASRAKVVRATLSIRKNVSSVSNVEEALISAGPDGTIFDIKFIDDQVICIGLSHEASSRLLLVPYHGPEMALDFSSTAGTIQPNKTSLELDQHVQGTFTRHTFGTATVPSAIPAKLEINGRKGRRAVCVVAQDQLRYHVFDIDSNDGDYGEDEFPGGEDMVME